MKFCVFFFQIGQPNNGGDTTPVEKASNGNWEIQKDRPGENCIAYEVLTSTIDDRPCHDKYPALCESDKGKNNKSVTS